jgi:hypothetical protein
MRAALALHEARAACCTAAKGPTMTTDDMTPATRADLRDAIAPLATKAELKDAIAGAIAPLATKAELKEAIAGAIAPLATKAELKALEDRLDAKFDALHAEFARMAQAMDENFRKMFTVLDEKYQHMPGEVAQLRREVDEHVANTNVHRAPRRTKRAKPRR